MPFRCLSYVAELLNKLVTDKNKLYRKALIKFPSPRFVVLYDGDNDEKLEREMRLSDAFDDDKTSLELVVTAYNINHGLNHTLLKKCNYLNDYCILVSKVKEGIATGLTRRDSISDAVKFCLHNGIMKGYLEFHSEEVFNMLALEWNLNDALQARFDDGFNDGLEKGEKKGKKQGENRLTKLISMLMEANKQDDIQAALYDESKRNELYKIYNLI